MEIVRLVLGPVSTNCYLVCDGGSAFVIDPADRAEDIISAAAERDCEITGVILTHGHYDHFAALPGLRKRIPGLAVYGHEEGVRVLGDPRLNCSPDIGGISVVEKPDIIVRDGDHIGSDSCLFEVIYTPGHTIDGICLKTDNAVFCGDTLFRYSIGRFDLPTGDMRQEIASIRSKLLCLDDDTLLYPGHGRATSIGDERRNNPYLRG